MVSRYRELFQKSADACLIIENGLFVDCNQATVNMLGFSAIDDVLNTHPSVLSPEFQPDGQDSQSKADEMMALAYKQGSHRFEWMHRKANGEVFPVEVLLTAISTDGKKQTLFTVWRDISLKKENQRFQTASAELATRLNVFMDIYETAAAGAAVIRASFESDSIAISFIDHENQINKGLYCEDTAEGERTPVSFAPLSTPFEKLDDDSIEGIPKPKLLNRTEADIKAKPMDRPFGAVARKSASLMFAPMMWDNKKLGEVTAQSYTLNKYSKKSLAQLQTMANQIGGALLRAKIADDLREEHKELRKNQAQLLISQQLARIGSWDYEPATKTMSWSPELYRIFDIDPDERITLRHVLTRIHPDDLERYKREIKTKQLVRTDYRIIRSDGSIRWLHEEIDIPRRKKGKTVFFRGCTQDITTSKEAEAKLSKSDQLRELLLDIITHDLKNPAGVIYGMSELAMEQIPDNKLIEGLYTTAARLLKVLDETSLLTQATFGESIPLEKIDLNNLLQEVGGEFSMRLEKAGMTLEIDVPQNVVIYANTLISEVFKNYISNAIKYARDGKKIQVKAEIDTEAVSVSITDFGNAIQGSNRERIFERNVQLSQEGKKGRGLGLAIVRRIATAHGATVWVEPNKPRGNRFFVRIPVPATNKINE